MASQQSNVSLHGSATLKARERGSHATIQLAPDEERGSRIEPTSLCAACAALEHQAIAALAYRYWQERGCPEGSAEEDWFRAEQDMQNKTVFGYSADDYYQSGPVLVFAH